MIFATGYHINETSRSQRDHLSFTMTVRTLHETSAWIGFSSFFCLFFSFKVSSFHMSVVCNHHFKDRRLFGCQQTIKKSRICRYKILLLHFSSVERTYRFASTCIVWALHDKRTLVLSVPTHSNTQLYSLSTKDTRTTTTHNRT